MQSTDLVPDFREVGLFHAVDEKDAVEVIDFVLDATGEQTVAFQNVRNAIEILVFDPDELGARDVPLDFGQGQATFLIVELFAGKKFDFRIGERHGHEESRGEGLPVKDAGNRVIGMIGNFNHAEAQGLPDLLGGQADALGVAHRLDHFLVQISEFLGEVGDCFAFVVKDALPVLCDAQGHVYG